MDSDAATIEQVLAEMAEDGTSERVGRLIDKDQPSSMERKKRQGYF
jgi:sulfate adenylyltransferase subunit 2